MQFPNLNNEFWIFLAFPSHTGKRALKTEEYCYDPIFLEVFLLQDRVLQLNQTIVAITTAPVLRSVKRGCCLLRDPKLVSAAKTELKTVMGASVYECPIPAALPIPDAK